MNKVLSYFREISKRPRCSGQEKEISNYFKEWAEDRGLEVEQDEADNIIIRKEGSVGYENSPTVILQGHMDMVCVKTADSDHDFTKDPIEIVEDGDYIRGNCTTLGADNGIAIAMAMSILEEDVDHPPLEVLITTSEETGLEGAMSLTEEALKGQYLINIDSEEEGILTAGCAGGETIILRIKADFEKAEKEGFKVSLSNLIGGHSGADIHLNRLNAIKVLCELVEESVSELQLSEIKGGQMHNTIPQEAEIIFISESFDKEKLENAAAEFRKKEEGLKLSIENTVVEKSMNFSDSKSLITALAQLQDGPYSYMDGEYSHIVQSSSNLAIIRTEEDEIVITDSTRSSSVEELKKLEKYFLESFGKFGEVEITQQYNPWTFEEDSLLREKAVKVYKDMYQDDMTVEIIHAGLECGVFQEKYPHLDMISIGPDMDGVHTTEEKLNKESAMRVYGYLLALLKEMK